MGRRSKLVTIGLPVLGLLAAFGATVSIVRNQPVKTVSAPAVLPPTQPPAASADAAFIGAAGLVEPSGEQIDIGAHVSGIVAKVFVIPGDKISGADPLFSLDDRTARSQVAIRRAELFAAERRLAQTAARAASLAAQVKAAKASAAAAVAELADIEDQVRSGDELRSRTAAAITDREVTRRRNAERAARARVEETAARAIQAEAELALISGDDAASLDVDRAAVEQAREALNRAEIDLQLLTVRSPITGTVLQVDIRAGEFAQAGALSSPLMVIGRLDPLHVRVDIDEVDIGRLRPGARAYASLRGQAGVRAELAFVRIEPLVVPKRALTGAGTERVDTRVLRVLYALPEGSIPAYPGQQVDVFIEALNPKSDGLAGNGQNGKSGDRSQPRAMGARGP